MESQSLSPVELHVVLVPLDAVQLVSPQAEVTNQPEAVSHLQDRQFSSREEEEEKPVIQTPRLTTKSLQN